MSRARSALEAGAVPLIVGLSSGGLSDACKDIQDAVDSGYLQWRDASRSLLQGHVNGDTQASANRWARLLDELDEGEQRRLFAVCVTDTLHTGDEADTYRSPQSNAGASPQTDSLARASLLVSLCRKRRIPVNVVDRPELCDFSFPATHRFAVSSPISARSQQQAASSLQVAVTTNGRGCRLAGRIRREIISALPRNVGDAVEKVGEMRELAKRGGRDRSRSKKTMPHHSMCFDINGDHFDSKSAHDINSTEDDLSHETTPLNSPVPQLGYRSSAENLLSRATTAARLQEEEDAERTKRRMRWVAQISEYWPIEYLGAMDAMQMKEALASFVEDSEAVGPSSREVGGAASGPSRRARAISPEDAGRGRSLTPIALAVNKASQATALRTRSQHSLCIVRPPSPPRLNRSGHIYLLGSGPGHPGLLTVMAQRFLMSPDTHLVLSDKLVPASILRLIPSATPLIIAKKFPGNAEGAQSELISLAVKAALDEGKNVVRLKQGDPFVYGRGGEEVLAFRKAGIKCTVVPGISSALAAPLMLGLPVTQRGAADSLVLCTGVGRGGKQTKLPGYQRSRNLLLLMGVARLKEVVQVLTAGYGPSEGDENTAANGRDGAPYPPHTPIALIERASSSDQRLIASTLSGIVAAVERCGEQRPPGMLMVGWAVIALEGHEGNVDILEDVDDSELYAKDQQRLMQWLGSDGYVQRGGLDDVYAQALSDLVGPTSAASEARSASENGSAAAVEEINKKLISGRGAGSSISVLASRAMSPPASSGLPADPFASATREASGWAPARYYATSGLPAGGWTEAETRAARGEAF